MQEKSFEKISYEKVVWQILSKGRQTVALKDNHKSYPVVKTIKTNCRRLRWQRRKKMMMMMMMLLTVFL